MAKALSAKQLAALAKGRRKLAAKRKKKRKGKRSIARRAVERDVARSPGKRRAKSRSRRAQVRRALGALGRSAQAVIMFVPSTLRRWF